MTKVEYANNPKVCVQCNTPIPYEKKRNSFCSRSCSASFNNTGVRHNHRDYDIKPIARQFRENKICPVCQKEFHPKRKNSKICSKECNEINRDRLLNSYAVAAGKCSAAKKVKRSKNEIALCELFKEKYKDTIHNEPMFNGWDADIIIPSLKLAILWNGAWHYKDLMKKHSYKQVQNRDMIKMKEIGLAGYRFYIVKDFENKMTPEEAFCRIEEYILKDFFNFTLF